MDSVITGPFLLLLRKSEKKKTAAPGPTQPTGNMLPRPLKLADEMVNK